MGKYGWGKGFQGDLRGWSKDATKGSSTKAWRWSICPAATADAVWPDNGGLHARAESDVVIRVGCHGVQRLHDHLPEGCIGVLQVSADEPANPVPLV